MLHIKEKEFEEILLREKIIERSEYEDVRREVKTSDRALADILLGRGAISEEYLVEILSSLFKVPVIDLRKIEIEREVLKLISEEFAKKESLAVFNFDEDKRILKVAMKDPGDLSVISFLETKLDCKIKTYVTSSDSLEFAFRQYKEKVEEKFSKIIAENVEQARTISGEVDLTEVSKKMPVVSVLNAIIEHALSLDATDIHFEPLKSTLLIRYRIYGIMREMMRLPKVIHSFLVARLKVLSNMAVDEHRKPQDGRFTFESFTGAVDIRISTIPLLDGEKAELRLLASQERPWNLSDLGLNSRNEKTILDSIKKTYGMIIAAGPTGCGKTTTLYSILHILNKPKVNIITIEDPIEYSIRGVNQVQVNPKAGITFASGLRAIVRQDPDIIMVGEIRDNETAKIAVNAALTGHLVLSTIHTTDAAGAIPRLLDLGIEPFLLSSTLNLVVAERLIQKICLNCIESYMTPLEVEQLIKKQLSIDKIIGEIPKLLYKGRGCNICGYKGYKDRIGIYECLEVSEDIKKLILKKADSSAIKAQAIKEGMTTLFYDGLQKVEAGTSAVEEVMRVIRR